MFYVTIDMLSTFFSKIQHFWILFYLIYLNMSQRVEVHKFNFQDYARLAEYGRNDCRQQNF